MRFVCLVEKAVACGVRCFWFFFPFCSLRPKQLDSSFKAHSSFALISAVCTVPHAV